MEFKKANDFRWDDNNRLMNNMEFLRWVRDHINRDYKRFFHVILKNDKPISPSFIVHFD
jgi:hypothetical protein